MASDDKTIMVAVSAASYNMILQAVFRIGTFVMNAALMRYVTKEMLGVVNVRLTLLYTTILFVSRESFRKACLTKSGEHTTDENKRKKMVNLIWVSVLVGIVSSFVLCAIWIFYLELPSAELVYHYRICAVLFALSAVVELLAEPLWIFGQSYSFVRLKVVILGAYILTRCIVSFTMVVFFPRIGLLSFAVGFCTSSVCYTLLYYIYFSYYISKLSEGDQFPLRSFKDFLPDIGMDTSFDPYYSNLVTSFYKQSLIKQFLTEGERYMMTLFSILTFAQQGVYDVINNLGSLAARIIFMPIEESYYIFYSLLLCRGKSGMEHTANDLELAAKSLSIALKVVSMIGFVILVFGYSYSYLLLQLFGGSMLTDNEGPLLLKTYCLYVLVIAINGITECFTFAAMHQSDVDKYNYKMLVFSIIFMVASIVLTRYLGSVGFILANCVNMLLRIMHSVVFIENFFKGTNYNPLYSILPSPYVLLSLVISCCVTYLSERTYCCAHGLVAIVTHISIGAVCFVVVLLVTYFTEHELSAFVRETILKKRGKSEEKAE